MTKARKTAPEKPLRIVALMEETLIPPATATEEEAKEAPWRTEYDVVSTLRALGHDVQSIGVGSELGAIRNAIWDLKPQIAFNLLEGFDDVPGYDANVVAYLELLKQPYTGCNSRGLLLARDKALAKKLLTYHRVPVPEFSVVPRGRRVGRAAKMPYPLFVKSLTLDASVGISQASVVENPARLEERVKFVHESLETDALVEQYVDGRELYVGILGNEKLQVLPVWELHFNKMAEVGHRVATARLKWNTKYQQEHGITSGPAADLPAATLRRIEALCKRAYRVLRINGYARMDLRLTDQGEVYLIEANPNPQIARGEDFADSAAAFGLQYPELLSRLLKLGLGWQLRRWT